MNGLKRYSELIQFKTFEERMAYLRLNSHVGEETFGNYRYVNQAFYTGPIWRRIKRDVIIRDNGCDLGIEGYDILGPVYVHHMNPVTLDDIINLTPRAIDPEYLISMSFDTHQAIHYSNENLEPFYPVERRPNDTCPWRR